MMDLKKVNSLLITIILFLILIILILIILLVKNKYNDDNYECEVCEDEVIIDTSSLENSNYIGIYSYEDDSIRNCVSNTTLVLNSDYSFIFHIDDCNHSSYYYGKYKIKDKEIIAYSVVLQDSTIDYEVNVDEEIYFYIVKDDVLTSIFGRSESIRLIKKYNII